MSVAIFCHSRLSRLPVLAVMASLVACGFQLQGTATMPPGVHSVFIATDDGLTPFAVEMSEAIERSGAVVAPAAGVADLVLRIQRDRRGHRVLSVSASNTPQEYEVYYWIDYSIDRGGVEVAPVLRLEQSRYISFDASKLLAKDREEDILHEAMAQDLASRVLRKIEAL
jgi:LPS-assembly lipoprotein